MTLTPDLLVHGLMGISREGATCLFLPKTPRHKRPGQTGDRKPTRHCWSTTFCSLGSLGLSLPNFPLRRLDSGVLPLEFYLWLFQKTMFYLGPPWHSPSWLFGPRVSVPRPCSAQEVHPALHIWMEFTPQSNSITGDLIRTAHVSAGALVKVAPLEMRVPGPAVHASLSLGAS